MAERVLPSRLEARMMVDPRNLKLLDPGLRYGSLMSEMCLPVLEAYASGRLVDREAIEQRIRSAMTLEVDEWADAIVNAALFEGEAHREAG